MRNLADQNLDLTVLQSPDSFDIGWHTALRNAKNKCTLYPEHHVNPKHPNPKRKYILNPEWRVYHEVTLVKLGDERVEEPGGGCRVWG